jgi:hypothetical protein
MTGKLGFELRVTRPGSEFIRRTVIQLKTRENAQNSHNYSLDSKGDRSRTSANHGKMRQIMRSATCKDLDFRGKLLKRLVDLEGFEPSTS